MNILPLKGVIVDLFNDFAIVRANKGQGEYKLRAAALNGAGLNEKVDLLIKPSSAEEGVYEVIFIKPQKKIKPIKFANFSTLLSHMKKTLERLKATLPEAASAEQEAEINEKIAWLVKGIELFS